MKVLGIIPARFGSSRFPGKPLIDLKGKTMIQRVYEGASKCGELSKVIVATDDERIYTHVRSFGGEVMMTSLLHGSGTERCAEVAAHFSDMEIVVNIQGDEPLVNPIQLTELIQAFQHGKVEIATLVSPKIDSSELDNPNRIKVVIDYNQNALFFSRSRIPSGMFASHYIPLKHIGLYAFRNDVLGKLVSLPATELEKSESLEQLRWLYYGYKIKTIETLIETPNIDTPADVEAVLKQL
jgi:3-deoxy-manno-octulosonate cytidylyltransferase (CMP-KDO synthetase)